MKRSFADRPSGCRSAQSACSWKIGLVPYGLQRVQRATYNEVNYSEAI